MASDIRANLVYAIENSSSLHEANLQCMAQIIAMKREREKADFNSKQQIQTLQEKVNSLIEIIEKRPNVSSGSIADNFQSLKGLWRKLLYPVMESNEEICQLKNRERLDYEENCAISLSILTNQCVSEVFSEYNGLQSNNDKATSFVFLRMINKVSNLCNHVSEINSEVARLERENAHLKAVIRDSVNEDVMQARRLEAAVQEARRIQLVCDEYREKTAEMSREAEAKDSALTRVMAKSLKDAQRIAELEAQLAASQELYSNTLKLCGEWQAFSQDAVSTYHPTVVIAPAKGESALSAASTAVAIQPAESGPPQLLELAEKEPPAIPKSTSNVTLADIADDEYDNASLKSQESLFLLLHDQEQPLPRLTGGETLQTDFLTARRSVSPTGSDHSHHSHHSNHSSVSHMSSPIPDLYELHRLPLKEVTNASSSGYLLLHSSQRAERDRADSGDNTFLTTPTKNRADKKPVTLLRTEDSDGLSAGPRRPLHPAPPRSESFVSAMEYYQELLNDLGNSDV